MEGVYLQLVINKHLFAAYCGMIKGGYDLMERSDPIVANICKFLAETDFCDSAAHYFACARTGEVAVNPYFPRGSDLAVACFFQEKSLPEYLRFLDYCESPERNDAGFIEWISQLPRVLTGIESHREFNRLYLCYRNLLRERFAGFSAQAAKCEEIFQSAALFPQPSLIAFAPNLLQSKYLADYAVVDGTLYVIAYTFAPEAIIHEYLHTLLKPHQSLLLNAVRRHGINKFINVNATIALGYMNSDSPFGAAHALEDCVVRALYGALDPSLDMALYCQKNTESGFCSVARMIQNLSNTAWRSLPLAQVAAQMLDC